MRKGLGRDENTEIQSSNESYIDDYNHYYICFFIRLLLMGGLGKLLSFDSQRTEVYKDTDITHYQWYIGKNAKKEYADKWGMDESIFPESITDNMNGLDYKNGLL